jgi:uncharacterized protein (DUF305 family)
MNRANRLAVTTITAALTLTLGACGTSSPKASPTSAEATGATASSQFSKADVTFAQSMIPHHEQAIEMVDIALDPNVGAGAKIKDLATRIKAGQGPEIKQLTALLKGWNKPVAMDTSDGHDMSSMTGMMSAGDMKQLGAMKSGDFDKKWAAMMIEHHKGAIEMSTTVKAGGSNSEILALADKVIAAQEGEIKELTPLAA